MTEDEIVELVLYEYYNAPGMTVENAIRRALNLMRGGAA